MRRKKFSIGLAAVSAIFTLTLLVSATQAAAQQEAVLHSFDTNCLPNCADGVAPVAGLILDASGNLYGTTVVGGAGAGTVFELIPALGGGSTEKILYNFTGGKDGSRPQAGLILDASGNLYGTTVNGGVNACGCGTVFELTPTGGGSWKETVLHSFGKLKDGAHPYAGLIFDPAGHLYGTTQDGGGHGYGTVFEMTHALHGWTEKLLHSFNSTLKGTDGFNPQAGLILDASGNLYGTTSVGGSGTCAEQGGLFSCGTVFELSPTATGSWKEKVLHSFGNDSEGSHPHASLIFDGAGNLYGTAWEGGIINANCGKWGCGAVFELTPAGGGSWTEEVLYNFNGYAADGQNPQGSLIIGAAGILYGTTESGGAAAGVNQGTVFELMPAQGGNWTEKVLHSFTGPNNVNPALSDGAFPFAGLISDSAGNLYGTTAEGGPAGVCGGPGCGTVFEITP
jgi:uncharacterized repeat protein (TIGR03803 family)